MTPTTTALLGAFAGVTIFLGLPVARLRTERRSWLALLNALATGILVFLLWDIITKAVEPIDAAREGDPIGLALLLVLFLGGIGVGLLSLAYFGRAFVRRTGADPTPTQIALIIATGI